MLKSTIARNRFLEHDVIGYFHDYYYTMNDPRNSHLKFINYLKNDERTFDALIADSERKLAEVLAEDFGLLVAMHGPLTVCGVPRSKIWWSYPEEKMGLKRGIHAAVAKCPYMSDGLDYIVRSVNTKCTHRARYGHGGEGPMPYRGITRDTCLLSPQIAGKNILLVDDIYTRTCNIDEDAIQALFDVGARSVVFYAVGYTVFDKYQVCA